MYIIAMEVIKMIISNYGQNRDVNATDDELKIFDIIQTICGTEHTRLTRKSDSYVSAVMPSAQGYGDMDLARFKFTQRAKWIKICPEFEKVDLTAPEDVLEMAEELLNGYRFNESYL